MIEIFSVIAPLFIIIFAGVLIQKLGKLGPEWPAVLNAYALKIGLPVLIFSALFKADLHFLEQAPLLASNSLFIFLSLFLAFVLGKCLRLNARDFKTLFICFAFHNVAYLGIPVLSQVYGLDILPVASLIVAVYVFWIFTIGIGYLEVQNQSEKVGLIVLKKLVKNPLLISIFLGLLLRSFQFALPGVVVQSLDMITASVTPTVLIVIGLFIGGTKFGKISDWVPVVFFSLGLLFALPALFYFGVQFFGFESSDYSSSILQSSMPLAITAFALADDYKLNKAFIARSVVLTTILSVFSIPFWLTVL